MSESRTTIDHDEIKAWAKSHNAEPAVVEPEGEAETSILRFKIANDPQELDTITWDHFFDIFEANKLALVHQGDATTFNKFVSREG